MREKYNKMSLDKLYDELNGIARFVVQVNRESGVEGRIKYLTDEYMVIHSIIIERAGSRCDESTQDISKDVLTEAAEIISGKRNEEYGEAEDCFGLIAAFWTEYVRSKKDDLGYSIILDGCDVAMMMQLLKIARTLGPEDKRDNYVDICGYAALAAKLKEFDE